jgi:AraC-like DNA-binding protein
MGMENAVLISGSLIGARELIGELGGDPAAVARKAGLSDRVFEDPDLFVQAGHIIDYLELAAAACDRPDFGLLHARRLPLGMLGHGWMIMRAAATIGEALMDFVHLYGLYTDAGSLHAQRCGEGLWIASSFLPVGRFGVTQAVHLTLGCICLFVRENLNHRWQPRRIEMRTVPIDPAPFVEFFGPGTCYGQDRDAILVDNRTLAFPMGGGSEHRAVHHAMVSQTAGHGTAGVAQVKSLLQVLVRHAGCSIETVGEALAVSPRTLQRRLEAAGTSYRILVDEVRADLAWRHVKRSGMSLNRVADLLGYHSPAAFSRAFRRWFQMSPRAARRI